MIQCREYAKGRCGGEICWNGRRPRCARYRPDRAYKAYGWLVTVQFGPPGYHTRQYHWRGCTENGARRKGMLITCAQKIISVEPVTEQEWIRAYGDPDLRD